VKVPVLILFQEYLFQFELAWEVLRRLIATVDFFPLEGAMAWGSSKMPTRSL
jgi:hypothetical protein